MGPEGFSRVGEYIHLRWYQDTKYYPCRVVCYNSGRYHIKVIYGKRERYTIEYVSMRNKDWHYIVDV